MYRYIALSWNSKDLARTATAQRLGHLLLSTSPSWQCVLNTSGLRVFQDPHPGGARRAYPLKMDRGVVLGQLFSNDLDEGHIPIDRSFDEKESTLIVESQGRHLIERYWGHYVAFLRDSGGERRFVVRDPTGGLPCFMTNADGIDVIFSDMEDSVRLNLAPFSFDWEHLTAFFVNMRMVTHTTGFKEVTQLRAGECAMIEDGIATTTITHSFYWDPARVYETGTIEDPDAARAKLKNIMQCSIGAWASCYDSIVHELSGGLDSSIVAACLANASADPDVLCFHYFTETSDGDERAYARAAANGVGLELIESEARVSEMTLEQRFNTTSRLATPAVMGFLPASELLKQRLVSERHAGAVFTGQGGDHLFQLVADIHIAAEYAHRHGLRPQLLRVAADTSRLTHQSIWSVLSTIVRDNLLGQPFDPYTKYEIPSILSDDAATSLNRHAYSHPWVDNASSLPAAKINQIFNIVDCQVYSLYPCRYAEQIHPLISQPIIECCLQVPSYVLTHGGRSRGLVRDAFAAEVPGKIIHRYSKGSTTSHFNRMLLDNATFLRELLLDGVLVREGVLDRCELEKQLSERELVFGRSLIAVMNAARAETWLATWTTAEQRTAA